MLTSLKGKLINASKIVLPNHTNEEKSFDVTVELDAGSEVLNYFQNHWVELHQINEENAASAAKVAKTIDKLYTKINKDYNDLVELSQMLSIPPTINKSIEICLNQIKDLHQSFESAEKKLLDLEDVIENIDLEKRKNEHRRQLIFYEEKKLANFEQLQSDLSSKHAKFLKEQELKENRLLEERQQVFQEAFKDDLETYKNLGSIPKIETNAQSSALLEEIQLDLDQNDLETFLNTK